MPEPAPGAGPQQRAAAPGWADSESPCCSGRARQVVERAEMKQTCRTGVSLGELGGPEGAPNAEPLQLFPVATARSCHPAPEAAHPQRPAQSLSGTPILPPRFLAAQSWTSAAPARP